MTGPIPEEIDEKRVALGLERLGDAMRKAGVDFGPPSKPMVEFGPYPADRVHPLDALLAKCPCEEHDYCDEACLCQGVARLP